MGRSVVEDSDEEGDIDPLCDISGNCEPFPEEEHYERAMCMYCGGERYKDYPYPGRCYGANTPMP